MAAEIVSLQEFGSTEPITAEYRRVLEATVSEQDALLALERKKSELQLRLHQMQLFIADLMGLEGVIHFLIRYAACLSMYPTKAMTWKPASVAA